MNDASLPRLARPVKKPVSPWALFLLSALITWAVIWYLAPRIAALLRPQTLEAFDAVYRPLCAGLLLGAYTLLLRFVDHSPSPVTELGLGLNRPWLGEWWSGTLFGGSLVAVAVIAIAVFGGYRVTIDRTAIKLAVIQLWILVSGALAEETAFRGYPFQRLVQAARPAGAVLIMSALFGAIHLANPGFSWFAFVNTLLVGLLLSIAFLKTRSLWVVWGIHFGWNFALGWLFGLPVSGLNQFSQLFRGAARGPSWLTGGDYGIEASLAGSVAIAIGVLALAFYRREEAITASPPSDEAHLS